MSGPARVMLRCVPTAVDAHFLKGYLGAGGIDAEIVEHPSHPVGAMPGAPSYELWVRASDRERATLLLQQAEHGPGDAGQSIRCVNCDEENPANFEVCWRCGGFTRQEDRARRRTPAAEPASFITHRRAMAMAAAGILVVLALSLR